MKLTLGRNIKKVRRKWSMDQTTFGDLMNSSKSMMSMFETGNATPKLPFLVQFCEISGFDIVSLCKGEVLDVDIPHQPLKPGVVIQLQESKVKYDLTNTDLLNLPTLVAAFLELQERVKKLEGEE